MGALLAKENYSLLLKNGINPTPEALYAAHMMGPAGALKWLKANANTPMDKILSADAINANASTFKNKDGSIRTAGEVKSLFSGFMGPEAQAKALKLASSKNVDGTVSAQAGTPVTRTSGGGPVSAPSTISPPRASSSGSSTNEIAKPKYSMDDIPMFIDDMGLILVSTGGLI